MLKIYYSVINAFPAAETVQRALQALPAPLQEKIRAYKNPWDSMLQLSGKLLLRELIRSFGLEGKIGLDDVVFSKNSKPYFNKPLYFSTARSGNIAVCAAATDGDVGIDVEKIALVDLALYQEYFTKDEWAEINACGNSIETFFNYWTKKEAVVKACGSGMFANLALVDVRNSTVRIDNVDYHLKKMPVHEGYVCHVACAVSSQDVEVRELEIWGEQRYILLAPYF